jgi:hypothetical protein
MNNYKKIGAAPTILAVIAALAVVFLGVQGAFSSCDNRFRSTAASQAAADNRCPKGKVKVISGENRIYHLKVCGEDLWYKCDSHIGCHNIDCRKMEKN